MGQQRMCLQMRKGSQRLSPREEGARSTRQHARPRVNSRVSWGGWGGVGWRGSKRTRHSEGKQEFQYGDESPRAYQDGLQALLHRATTQPVALS